MKNWKKLLATGAIASLALFGAACDDAETDDGTGTVTDTETAPAGDVGGGTDTEAPTETES